jgi:hypothetical protein
MGRASTSAQAVMRDDRLPTRDAGSFANSQTRSKGCAVCVTAAGELLPGGVGPRVALAGVHAGCTLSSAPRMGRLDHRPGKPRHAVCALGLRWTPTERSSVSGPLWRMAMQRFQPVGKRRAPRAAGNSCLGSSAQGGTYGGVVVSRGILDSTVVVAAGPRRGDAECPLRRNPAGGWQRFARGEAERGPVGGEAC